LSILTFVIVALGATNLGSYAADSKRLSLLLLILFLVYFGYF
jgi:hypothetical protein